MIKLTAGCCCLLLGTTLHAEPSSSMQPGAQSMHVTLESEYKDLARGYAKASAQLTKPPVTLAFKREGTTFILEDVRTVRDSDGALVVEVGKGVIYLINPRDVLYITDGSQLKERIVAVH